MVLCCGKKGGAREPKSEDTAVDAGAQTTAITEPVETLGTKETHAAEPAVETEHPAKEQFEAEGKKSFKDVSEAINKEISIHEAHECSCPKEGEEAEPREP